MTVEERKAGPMPGFVAGYVGSVLVAIAKGGFIDNVWLIRRGVEAGFIPAGDLPTVLRVLAAFLEQPPNEKKGEVFLKRLSDLANQGRTMQMAAFHLGVEKDPYDRGTG